MRRLKALWVRWTRKALYWSKRWKMSCWLRCIAGAELALMEKNLNQHSSGNQAMPTSKRAVFVIRACECGRTSLSRGATARDTCHNFELIARVFSCCSRGRLALLKRQMVLRERAGAATARVGRAEGHAVDWRAPRP